jgi:protocatechuate 3,4-dioxygenase beta subunit
MEPIHDDDAIQSKVIGRRQILRTASALGVLSFARFATAHPALARALPGGTADDLDVSDLVDDTRMQAVCVLTPSETQGPYYLDLNLNRIDITEGYAGLPTRIFLHVVRASDCTPVPNAIVDLWHNNAPGTYSGFASQGTAGLTFLRGVQTTDANGTAYFDTIYPGWYPGRTVHMHLKVRPSGGSELTTQLYFKKRLTARVHSMPPYDAHGQSPTTNDNDGLFLPETVTTILGVIGGVLQLEVTIGIA